MDTVDAFENLSTAVAADKINVDIECLPADEKGLTVRAYIKCSFYDQQQTVLLSVEEARRLKEKLDLVFIQNPSWL